MAIADTDAFAQVHSAHYPVNLRITIPLYPRSIFLTLIVGMEKRNRGRRSAERRRHPVSTYGNVFVVTMLLGVAMIATLFAALVASAL